MWAGIDFGTSNSAVALWKNGQIEAVELGNGNVTIPTALFFDEEEQELLSGDEANTALIEGYEGRYMRALKSVLGTPLMGERQLLLGQRRDFYEIISLFILRLKRQAEETLGQQLENVVAGCPVTFMGARQKAREDLHHCFERAGFKNIEFLTEPEAVALAYNDHIQAGEYGLVVDIGGGTSDFTLFKKRDQQQIDVISTHGVDIGGTDFDQLLNFNYFMPNFGRGHVLKLGMSQGEVLAPNKFYSDLSSWPMIPFSYSLDNIKLVKEMVKQAYEPEYFKRLLTILEERLGHDLAFAAEKTKIDLNGSDTTVDVDLGFIERELSFSVLQDDFNASMLTFQDKIEAAICDCIGLGDITADQVQNVVLVGGSSSMNFVKKAIGNRLPHAATRQEAIFTAISDGLAVRASQL
ncbi:Hsp70 family protein [Curvivirga sp.]|uniref:Hsp70 family protein n=1 Tax=Curvivirga sp. TaxID=2856848 RepID=UPI003B58F2A9